jgi:hypothetical protein
MYKNSLSVIVASVFLVAVIGCAVKEKLPGTGGKNEERLIEKTEHPAVPDGVKCYVCHKREMPEQDFHTKYGTNCEQCHGKTTWMAYKFPHEAWGLGLHRKMQCNRCHTQMNQFDFSVWHCWGCHHDKSTTAENHKKQGIDDITNCLDCHKGTKEE